jgi:tRNA (guanine-N7-)-methyltransferase
MADVRNRRLIYGRRQGHKLHPRQARLVRDMLPALRPDMTAQSVAGWFGGAHFDAYALEIGFGGGEHLAARAQENRKTGFIGCEPFINGVAKLLIAIEAAGLDNVRVHGDDARDILAALPDAALACVYLLYPDPWPKLRHHKRRFVNDENLRALFRVMQPGATLHIASDIPDYVSWSLMHLRRHGGFDWQAEAATDWAAPFSGWPGTRYEAKALAAGRVPAYLRFTRRAQAQPGTL